MNNFDEIAKAIDTLPDEEIWTLYAYLGLKLKERKLVRTRNIVGERGEFLAIKIYNETPSLAKLQAAPEGTQNVDALSRKGERYSNKIRSSYPRRRADGVLGERAFILRTSRFSTLARRLALCSPPRGNSRFPDPLPSAAFIPVAELRGILRAD